MAKVPEFYNFVEDYKVFSLVRREIEACTVNSMADVYFGPPRNNLWAVDSVGENYISKFKIDGHPVLERFIEKNKIAREMIKRGENSDSVTKELEFADHFFYLGTSYSWPKSKIKIEIK